MGNLTRNFSRSEFSCKGANCCGHSAPISKQLVLALQDLRDSINVFLNLKGLDEVPLIISSGFRCMKYNVLIQNSSPNSQHCLGLGSDVLCPKNLTMNQFLALARAIPAFKGIGIGTDFLHLDIRDVEERTEWTY